MTSARIRLEMGTLSVLVALSGLGVFDWRWVLLGWGCTEAVIAVRDMRNSTDD